MYGVTKDMILNEATKKFGALEHDNRKAALDKIQEIVDDMYFELCDEQGSDEDIEGYLADLLFYTVVSCKMNCRTTEELAVRGIARFRDELAES